LNHSRVDLDLAQTFHRLPPEFVKLSARLSEFAIPDEERREAALVDERLVQRQDHRLVVDHVKWMPELGVRRD